MSAPLVAVTLARPRAIHQPCGEACTAFRLLAPDRWPDFGLCVNERSPRQGYPVRLGRECHDFRPPGMPDTRAPSGLP
jgi:hypothetical protein